MTPREQADENPIFRCITGSRAYGTSTPQSDLDVRGVFAAAPISMMTPFYPVEQVEGPGDTVLFELSKYVRLVCDQNPNIVELLWVDPSDILFTSPAWQLLHDRRSELLTTKVRITYGGFATQALKAMKGHERWLNKPQPEEPPKPRDFMQMVHNFSLGRWANSRLPGEGDWTAVGIGQDLYLLHEGGRGSWFDAHGNLRTFTRENVPAAILAEQPAALVRFDRKNYELRKRDHENYWTWQRNRNKTRGALEEKLGFDAKNGAHLIRLLRTAYEILTEGVVKVRRPDAAELLRIRHGEVGYEQVLAMAEELEAVLPAAEAASSLPRTVNQAMVGEIVMEMYDRCWSASRMRSQVAMPPAAFTGAGAPDLRGRVIVLDLELTGFADAGHNQIVEIGAVEIMGGRLTGRTFHTYVNPQAKLNHFASRVHGLTRRFLADKPTLAEIAPDFLAFIGTAPVLAHNAPTDVMALNNDLQLAGLPAMESSRSACTMRLASSLFGERQIGVDALCDIFEVDRTPRTRGHSALLDASLLAQCVLHMGDMPGYGTSRNVWVHKNLLRTRAHRRAERREATRAERCSEVAVSDDGRSASFVLTDGRVLTCLLPDYPADTHAAVARFDKVVLIVRRDDLPESGKEARVRPDNPLGQCLLFVRDGQIVEHTPKSRRARVSEGDATVHGQDEPCGPSMR